MAIKKVLVLALISKLEKISNRQNYLKNLDWKAPCVWAQYYQHQASIGVIDNEIRYWTGRSIDLKSWVKELP